MDWGITLRWGSFVILVIKIVTTQDNSWTNRKYQFTVHNVNKTWDEARVLCMSSGPGVSLLTVHDESAWGMWVHLLGQNHNYGDYSGSYWFGLVGSISSPNESLWVGCEDSPFKVPLVPDFNNYGPCIYLWTNREIFIDVFQDKWYSGQDCLNAEPFICSVRIPEHECFNRTCNDIIVPANSTDCTSSLCFLFATNATCNQDFLQQEQFCHLWVNDEMTTTRTICYLPDNLKPVAYCPVINAPINYTAVTDNVEDNCPVLLEPVDIHGLFRYKHYLYYKNATTWNSAREVCAVQGGKLLTFEEQEDMEKWYFLLSTTLLLEGEPWIGLHVPALTQPVQIYWDDCDLPFFADQNGTMNIAVNGSCVRITDGGITPELCNESRPFICEFNKTESSCYSTTCDERILALNETACNMSLCKLNAHCTVTYLPQASICHVDQISAGKSSVICLGSRNITENCNGTATVSDTYFSDPDDNPLVSDNKCSPQISTTTTPSITHDPNVCRCSCERLSDILREPPPEEANLTVEEKVEKIIAELTVDVKNTTANKRKYISATDRRPSSAGIGAVAGAIIFSVFGVIVLIDLSRIFHEIHQLLRMLLVTLKLHHLVPKDSVTSLDTTSTKSTVVSNSSTLSSVNDYITETENPINGAFEMTDSVNENVPPMATSLE